MAGQIPDLGGGVQLNPSQLAWGSNPAPPISELKKFWIASEAQTATGPDDSQTQPSMAAIWRAKMNRLNNTATQATTSAGPIPGKNIPTTVVPPPELTNIEHTHDMLIDKTPQPIPPIQEQANAQNMQVDSIDLDAAPTLPANKSESLLEWVFLLISQRDKLLKDTLAELEDSPQQRSTTSNFTDADLDKLYSLIKSNSEHQSREAVLAKVYKAQQEATLVARREAAHSILKASASTSQLTQLSHSLMPSNSLPTQSAASLDPVTVESGASSHFSLVSTHKTNSSTERPARLRGGQTKFAAAWHRTQTSALHTAAERYVQHPQF
ncbi:hypothetical protein CPB83DRAFT_841161 [Crepidotus variabilis]|uniref:Uncharacterized protein n=1 Tax=Crepidotus variabilis TaxID=179855 RepID=A0A9P6JHV5_9AGAR|nr:hypothetical protein CPB83DRAFT_841161 [Crepidotus variabilis]